MTSERPLGRPLAEPSEDPEAAFSKAPAGSPPTRRSLDRTGAAHLKSSRISRLSAWNGMLRTRIFDVVCFLRTCFFRADVRAGLDGWRKEFRLFRV